MAPQRTRTLSEPCPRCGGELQVVELGIGSTGFNEASAWRPIRRMCANGCPLTDEEFPDT